MLGSSNIDAGPAMAFMTGNLVSDRASPGSDLPSNRLAEISVRVRQVCDKYDLPYTTGSLLVQYGKAWRTIAKLSLPNKHLSDSADDAPENPQREDVRRARAGIRRD
jgi:linoleoyl-CoA desaturase